MYVEYLNIKIGLLVKRGLLIVKELMETHLTCRIINQKNVSILVLR